MKTIRSIEFHQGSKEERLPDFSSDFPYIASRSELDFFPEKCVPWHWHKSFELFYTASGSVEYFTPGGSVIFPAGSGGLANSNILHSTRPRSLTEPNVQFVHIFAPSFLFGGSGSRSESRYLTPLLNAPHIELIPLFPENPQHADALRLLKHSWSFSPDEFGYELKLRNTLSELWLQLLTVAEPLLAEKPTRRQNNDKLKEMMVYVHDHYSEPISVQDLAASAYLSERACYRAFRDSLKMTPIEYLQGYRLQAARRLLAETELSVTEVGQLCGLGSSSYFASVFRKQVGCTPSQYRENWQNIDSDRQKSDSPAFPATL